MTIQMMITMRLQVIHLPANVINMINRLNKKMDGLIKQEGGIDISVKEVYTCFTSEKIRPFGSAMAGRAS